MAPDEYEFLQITFVCFNCGADIASVLNQLKTGDYPPRKLKIFVVDNASTDDSLLEIASVTNLDVKIIKSTENLGFGRGCNLVLPFLKPKVKLLFLNPDIKLFKNSITNLLKFSHARPASAIWGGVTLDSNGAVDSKNAWREPTLKALFFWAFFLDFFMQKFGFTTCDGYSQAHLSQTTSVDAVSGCFFLIDTEIFISLGGFDEDYFMYSEEIDLCRRARALGASPQSTNTASIIHEGSKTLTSETKLHYLFKSKLIYAKKHWARSKFIVARSLILAGSCLRLLLNFSYIFGSDRSHLKLWSNFIKAQLKWNFSEYNQ